MKLVPTLYAERLEGHVRYRLEIPERDLRLPVQEQFDQALDQATLVALRNSADALLRGTETVAFVDEARRRGAGLYRTLLPRRLGEQLKELSGPLLVNTSLLGIPWELLYDGEEFWGLRYAIGKRIIMNRPLTAGVDVALRSRPRALVVGSDPRGDLPFVRAEVERICRTLKRFTELCCVSGDMASFDAVTGYLREGFDLIHYCGHVVADRGSPALLLADETPLAASVIESNLAGKPLVFLNGCASARDDERAPTQAWEERFSGVAYGFLFGGATGVVGTLCDVSDRHAAGLAESFYQQTLLHVPVGEALRGARESCRTDPAAAMSPTWLSFVLYGNPAQVLRPGVEPPGPAIPQRIPSPRDTQVRPRAMPSRLAWTGILVLVAALAGLLYRGLHRSPVRGPLVIGVMEVHARGKDVPDWMPQVTRDALNTIFSKLSGVRVYSRQKIDFTREKRHLSEIEAAETLGMTAMIAGNLAVSGDDATLELQVVDIATGMLQASERATGQAHGLIELQNQVAIRTLRALGIIPSEAELKAILAARTNETLETYKLLNETLGGETAGENAPRPSKHMPEPTSRRWGAVAFAQTPDVEEKAIYALIERYRAALEHKDIDTLSSLQADMTERQRSAHLQYFKNASGLAVRISDVDIQIEGDEALATFTREDVFTDAPTGRPLRIAIRISSVFGRQDGSWTIRSLRKPS